MKILVFGVVYPGVENYLDDYFSSLDQQTYTEFDIFIIEDGLDLQQKYRRKNLITQKSEEGDTPADIRYKGIEYSRNKNYEVIIFTDCDDFFSENRVEKTIHSLKNVDFCVNKLIPIYESGKIITGMDDITIPSQFSINEILNTNFFGMSNTAININSIPKDFYIPSDLVAVDWWLYTILLLHNRKYVVDEKVVTFYRQHDKNTVGMPVSLEKGRLLKGIIVKTIHYMSLLEYCENLGMVDYSSLLKKRIFEVNELNTNVKDENFIANYLTIINDNYEKIKTGWWSEILPLNEWSKYE